MRQESLRGDFSPIKFDCTYIKYHCKIHYWLFSIKQGSTAVRNHVTHTHTHSCKKSQCTYTECNRRNGPDFRRVFLRSNYTDITQNTYIQSWTFTEIMAREKSGLLCVLIFVVLCIMLNSEINPTRCNNCVYSLQWLYSTCFGWQFHPSSGVQCCIWPFK